MDYQSAFYIIVYIARSAKNWAIVSDSEDWFRPPWGVRCGTYNVTVYAPLSTIIVSAPFDVLTVTIKTIKGNLELPPHNTAQNDGFPNDVADSRHRSGLTRDLAPV